MLRNVSRTGRLTATVALGTTLALTLAACNRDSGPAGGEGGDGGAADGASVTLSLSTLNNPFFVDVRDGAQTAADELGIELEVVDAQNDSTAEANQIANSVTGGAEGLIINPVDSDAAGAGIGPAVQADLPVVAVDRAVNGAEVDSLVSSDNVAGGKQAADALAAAVGEKGEVIVLQGVAGTSASRDRGEGFAEGIAAYPDIEVVATQTANFDRAEVRSLSDLLVNRNGVAIVATHSPVVLQEVPRSCVWKLRRSGHEMAAERPEIETFGENVGVLTREVFGLEVTHAGFHKLIQDAVEVAPTFEQALERFGGQLGAEGRAILRSLFAERQGRS